MNRILSNRIVLGLIMMWSFIWIAFSIAIGRNFYEIEPILGVSLCVWMVIPHLVIILLTYFMLTDVFKYKEKGEKNV